MGFGVYFKTRAGELLLCACASAALCYTFCSGFFATVGLLEQPWIIALSCLALTALVYLVSATPRLLLVGGIALAVLYVAALVVCLYAGPGSTPVDDVEGNHCIFLLIAAGCVMAVFLLSRRRSGCIALLVLGVAACAFVEYLYWNGHVAAFGVFIVSGIGLTILRNYQVNLLMSESDRYSFASVSLVGIGLGLLSVGVACAVFMLAIAPLDPPNVIMKLFTEYRRAEVMEVSGSESVEHVQGDEMSENTTEGDQDTSDSPEQEDVQANLSLTSLLGMNTDMIGDSGATTGLLQANLLLLLVPLGVVLLVVACVLIKKWLRRRRYERMVAPGDDGAVVNLYLFFIDRLGRLGKRKIECPVGESLVEFSRNCRPAFRAFERVGGAQEVAGKEGEAEGELARDGAPTAFDALTEAYGRVVYGGAHAGGRDRALFDQYYESFYANVRKYVGSLRYVLLFFRI